MCIQTTETECSWVPYNIIKSSLRYIIIFARVKTRAGYCLQFETRDKSSRLKNDSEPARFTVVCFLYDVSKKFKLSIKKKIKKQNYLDFAKHFQYIIYCTI